MRESSYVQSRSRRPATALVIAAALVVATTLAASPVSATTVGGSVGSPGAPGAPGGPGGPGAPGSGGICWGSLASGPCAPYGGCVSSGVPPGAPPGTAPTHEVPVTQVGTAWMTWDQYVAAGSPNGPVGWQPRVCGWPSSPAGKPSPPKGWSRLVGKQPSSGPIRFPGYKQWIVYYPIIGQVTVPALSTLVGTTKPITDMTGTYAWAVIFTDQNGLPYLTATDMRWHWGSGAVVSSPTCTTSGGSTTCTSTGEFVHVTTSARVRAVYVAVAHCYELFTPSGGGGTQMTPAACTPHDPGSKSTDTITITNGPSAKHAVQQFEAVDIG